MATSAGPDIVASNRLVLNLDASDKNSYPGSGTTWYDLSPYQNHGTLTNGPTHGYSDNGNHYIDFDGTNDYVDFGNDSSLSGLNDDAINTSQAFTFEVVLDAHATSLQCIMGMSSMQSGTDETQMSINNSRYGGVVRTYFYSNQYVNYAGDSDDTPVDGTSGNYQHVVMRVGNSSGLHIYLNGERAPVEWNTNGTLSIIVGGHANETNSFRVGANSFGSSVSSYYLNGRVALVRVYNDELDDADIRHNFEVQRARFNITNP